MASAMFYVYMLASKPYGTLYTGTTSDLVRRIWEHKNKVVPGFTKRYGVDRLVWFEAHQSRNTALQRHYAGGIGGMRYAFPPYTRLCRSALCVRQSGPSPTRRTVPRP